MQQGFTEAALLRAGVLSQRDDGSTIDRFRNRLMIPICRDNGCGHRVRGPRP
jgi:DNA primase